MFGMFRKEKPIPNEKRLLSDHDIVSEIVSIDKARENLSADEYKVFYDIYLEYSTSNEKHPTFNQGYKDRVYSIANAFELEGIPLNDICVENPQLLQDYNQFLQELDNDIYSLVSEFSEVIDRIAVDNNINRGVANAYGCIFMRYSFELLRYVNQANCKTQYFNTVFNGALNNYTSFVIQAFNDDDGFFEKMILEFKKQMQKQFQDVINRRGATENNLKEYAIILLEDIGAPNDKTNLEKLEHVLFSWGWDAQKFKLRY